MQHCLYEHLRPDSGAPFYVGKGTARRAKDVCSSSRSPGWNAVRAEAGGVHVRVIASGLDEELAFLAEQERIDQLRRLGVTLANKGDGGPGNGGATIGRKASFEERLRHSVSRLGNRSRTGQTMPMEERIKHGDALRGRPQMQLQCPHCGLVGGNAMRRWHYDNCRKRG